MVLLSELLVKSIKFILFTYYLYNFGFIKGIAFYYISTYLYQLILYYTIGIEEVTSLEFMFAPLRNENKFTMTGYFILESFEPEKIKNLIIEKAIKKFKRLRLKLTYTLGNYYWKEFPVEEAFNQVKIYSDINLKINDDILKYVLKEQATPFNLNEFPYEFQLLRHGQGGFLLTKFDHSLSDGIGLLGLLIAMADNYNINLYPKLGEASMFSIFMLQLLSPFYVIEKIYNAIKIKYIDGPFKLGKGKKRSNIKKAAISKYYSFDAISKISKENKLTFNDMIIAIIVMIDICIYFIIHVYSKK